MSQATNNTITPSSRRRFITAAAGGSILAVGSLVVSAIQTPTISCATVAHIDPADPIYAAIETYKKHAAEHSAALDELDRLDGTPGFVDCTEQSCHAEFRAFDALLSMAATTLPGLRAKLTFLQSILETDEWMFSDRDNVARLLIEGFSASLANVTS